MQRKLDAKFMRRALTLARKGLGRTSPNPPVGAVIVKGGRIIGQGYHKKAGENHAEVNAINAVKEDSSGSTLYVTLEPCNHYGRTPPCTQAILRAGIKRVIIGTSDPNPKVAGGGSDYLTENGVEVDSGCLEEECRCLIAPFAKHFKQGLPWVRAKVACSMDGKIATRIGHSQWITNREARDYGHKLRNISDGIIVGKGTVLSDDPQLTCRLKEKKARDPVRFILDSGLSIDLNRRVLQKIVASKTWIIGVEGKADSQKKAAIEKTGARVWLSPPDSNGKVDAKVLLSFLAGINIQSLLVEGGAMVHGDFFDKGLVDEAYFFYAPIIIGGREAKSSIGGDGPLTINECTKLHSLKHKKIGDNWLVHGRVTDINTFFRK